MLKITRVIVQHGKLANAFRPQIFRKSAVCIDVNYIRRFLCVPVRQTFIFVMDGDISA